MLAKGKKTSNPDEKSGEKPCKCKVKNWYENNQRSIIAVALIAIAAFVLRFIFAFGTSVGSGTALSGGTSASEHLHAIVAILDGGCFIGTDGTLNYPFGSTNTNPVLYDLILTPFALLGKAMGMTSIDAASAVLAWASIIFGVLATVMAYFVGKEFLGEKKHGYLAAAFIAFCPVVISNTVFSNGTETAFVAFLFMVMSFFLLKGTKCIDSFSMPTDKFTDIFRLNKSAMKYAVISGIFFALILLSWNGFRSIANALCVILAIMVLVDRFRKKDSRVIAVYFSIVLLIGMIAATAYYVPSGLWDAVLSGVLISTLLSVAVCLSYASLQKIPWTITIPVYAIVLIAVFVALFYLAPDYFNVIFNGNSVYAEKYGSLVTSVGLSVSQLATFYGFVTLWFPFIMVIMMLWKLPRNINSPAYLFTILWVCFGIGYGIVSEQLAVIYASAYALGFAFILAWLFDNVKFKEYFDAIRASDIKSVWKKLLKPIPFLSIVGVLLLICAPNALYAIDASIPSNDMDDHEGLNVGALNYYIRTDSDWKVNNVLSQYSSEEKNGAMLTWSEYADDASTYGKFSVTTDTAGNGARYSSLTLLANGMDNSAVADMTTNLILYKGVDASKGTLIAAGMSEADYALIKDVIDNPGKYREEVLKNPDTYGAFATSISDETITYVKCSSIMTASYNAYQISNFYEKMAAFAGKGVGYVMITADMLPISYGGSSLFAAMAKMGDYAMYDDYGTVSEFMDTSYLSMYYTMYSTGVYSYTDSMTDSLLWRSYIGKSPAEAGFTGYTASYEYLVALTLSDGKVKATPGYGLANFEVDESSWYVKYNEDPKATADSDGWVKMLASDAQDLQEINGGLINYLAGYPVVMKYVSNSSGTAVSGKVTDYTGSNAIQGIRVSVVDDNGNVRSSAVTDTEGKFTVLALEGNTIKFISASTNLSDGTNVKTVKYTSSMGQDLGTVKIQKTTIDFKIVDSDGDDITQEFPAKAKFVGSNTMATMTWDLDDLTHEALNNELYPDVYDITVTDPTGKNTYATATYTVVPGENTMYKIKVTMTTVTVSLVDDMGVTIGDEYVDKVYMVETTYGTEFEADNLDGTVKIDALEGTYVFYAEKSGSVVLTSASVITVPDTVSATVTYLKSTVPSVGTSVDGKLAVIYTMGYQDTTTKVSTAMIPTGTAGNATYTIYSVKDDSNVFVAKSDGSKMYEGAAVKISGTMKSSSDTAVAGTIVLITDGMQIPASADSDGKYSVLVPKDKTYTLYAQYGTEVYIEKDLNVTAEIVDKTITTAAGTKVSGYVYWGSTNQMFNVPVTVVYDGVTYDLMTSSKGAYSMYIPEGKVCSSITVNVGGTAFYFANGTAKDASKTVTDTTSETFTAKAESVTVKNSLTDTTIVLKIDGTKIESAGTSIPVSSNKTWTVKAYDSSENELPSSTIPVSVREITDEDLVISDYVTVTFNGVTTPSISVTSIANDDGDKGDYKSSSKNNVYFFKRGTIADPFEYLVTVKDSTDTTKIAYACLSFDSASTNKTINVTVSGTVTVKGFVGLKGTGTVSVDDAAVDNDNNLIAYTVDIDSDGSYSMVVPIKTSGTYDFSAEVEVTSGDYTYTYTADRSIPFGEFEVGNTYVRNFAVSYFDEDYDADVSGDLSIKSMSGSTIEFEVTVNNLSTEKVTYLLSAGSDWQELLFYTDNTKTTQITSVTVNNGSSQKVYAVGKISKDNAGFGTEGLSVGIKDINGNASCTAVFDDATGWESTTYNMSSIEYGVDVVGKSEYRYAVKIINDDNFTKKYKVSDIAAAEGTLTDKWFVTVVDGNIITEYTGSPITVDVLGFETATVYVKITLKDAASEKVPSVTFKVTSDNGPSETFTAGEDTEGGITVTSGVATVKSVEQKTLLDVTGMSASGRGVYNEQEGTPAYVWVLFGIVILLVMFVMWIGMKRGVFSRKK